MLTLTKAPENWEILQQTDGFATFTVAGTFDSADKTIAILYVGVMSEDDSAPVIDWVRADTDGDTFSASLTVPAGGLYRLEVRSVENERFSPTDAKFRAIRHHIGVGDNYLIAGAVERFRGRERVCRRHGRPHGACIARPRLLGSRHPSARF